MNASVTNDGCICSNLVINLCLELLLLGGGNFLMLCLILYLLRMDANIVVVNVHLVALDK